MRRRDLLFAVGVLTFDARRSATGQELRPKRVGVITQGGPYQSSILGLREGLKAAGLEQERHFVLLLRDARGDPAAAEEAARQLEGEGADLVVAIVTSVALATKRATVKVPIVFAVGADPVAFGLVDSMAKPGGRLTGVHFLAVDLTAKRLELLRELVPTVRRIVTFHNPANAGSPQSLQAARDGARLLGLDLVDRPVSSPEDIREASRALATAAADAFFFVGDSTVVSHYKPILDAASALRMPTMAYQSDLVAEGALAGYGLDYRQIGRLAARYVARILAGAHPNDLPIETVTRPALTININTARALGLTISHDLLARADEVIE
jgi:putative ABC transport system substrate-binding protein